MPKRKQGRGKIFEPASKPCVLFEHARVIVLSTSRRCWIEIDNVVITQGLGSIQTLKYYGSDNHMENMGKEFAKWIDNGWHMKVGKNGRLYHRPPRNTGRLADSQLTDLDVLAALGEAIGEYQKMKEWDAEFTLTRRHLGRHHLSYDTTKWSGTAPMVYVLHAIAPNARQGWRGHDLKYVISGELRRMRRLGLVNYIDARGQRACGKRPDGAYADKMWFITDFGYEALIVRKQQQRKLIERAMAR